MNDLVKDKWDNLSHWKKWYWAQVKLLILNWDIKEEVVQKMKDLWVREDYIAKNHIIAKRAYELIQTWFITEDEFIDLIVEHWRDLLNVFRIVSSIVNFNYRYEVLSTDNKVRVISILDLESYETSPKK